MARARLRIVFLAAVALVGCGESKKGQVSVMTYNLYLGAGLDPLIGAIAGGASPQTLATLAKATWDKVQATNFAERAQKIADEVKDAGGPDFLCLQEVALWRTQSPGDGVPGNATTVAVDFLGLLQAALAQRGLSYQVAAQVQNFDGELLTAFPPSNGPDVRYTDRDVILARSGVSISNGKGANYDTRVPLGGGFNILRGWVSTEADVNGQTIRIVSTHLEVEATSPPLFLYQQTQANELVQLLADESKPTLLLGDFNSAADRTTTWSYDLFRSRGFGDAWADQHPGEIGRASCRERV
jgi:endonuclease/exonuclease/phosphatase family metal-dependent hydrolase